MWRKVLRNLYPFLMWVGIYFFMIGAGYPQPSLKAVAFKVLPIISLLFMVGSAPARSLAHGHIKFNIFLGLVLSAVGDVFMVWMNRGMLLYGGIAFGLAHTFYIRGFGFKHKGGRLSAVVSFMLFSSAAYWITSQSSKQELEAIDWLMVSYLFMLCSMFWRGLSRFLDEASFAHACASMGGYLFIVSDFILLTDKYVRRVRDANMWIMLTYYAAQLGIALSASTYQMTLDEAPAAAPPAAKRRKVLTKSRRKAADHQTKESDSDG